MNGLISSHHQVIDLDEGEERGRVLFRDRLSGFMEGGDVTHNRFAGALKPLNLA